MPAFWKPTHLQDTEQLSGAREQLHQAIQIVAAVGRTYKHKVKDDHYANFLWNNQLEMLQGHVVEGDENISAALELTTLNIHLLNSGNETISNFDLNDKTQKQALIWLEEQLLKMGLDGNSLSMELPYEIPLYPTAKGKEFQIDSREAFQELSNYFSNTDLIVNSIIGNEENASATSCWPHHFDLASLITLDDTGNPETSTSIGIGLSPGDEGYNQPYYYLTPWPYPKVTDLTPMSGAGNWHTDGWVGGVLTSTDLITNSNSHTQEETVRDFFKEGLNSLKSLMK